MRCLDWMRRWERGVTRSGCLSSIGWRLVELLRLLLMLWRLCYWLSFDPLISCGLNEVRIRWWLGQ